MPLDNPPAGVTNIRALAAYGKRVDLARAQALVAIPSHPTNGDEQKLADFSGSYSKCLPQIGYGLVQPAAFKTLRAAAGPIDGSSLPTASYDTVPLGGARPLNGPQAALAYTLVGTDPYQFGAYDDDGVPVVPAPPSVESDDYAVELIELYWASLLRDVPFSEYPGNTIAIAAASELNAQPLYKGPRDSDGVVRPHLLFRGGATFADKAGQMRPWFAGETAGPYVSQFLVQPTHIGVQNVSAPWVTTLPGVDYLTNINDWQAVQQGILNPALPLCTNDLHYAYNGRSLSTFSHQDELFQAYLDAYLVLRSLHVPYNPTNPYASVVNQQAFGTFGPPDIAATMASAARAALNAVWYQKWVVHLRHRPESGGALVALARNPSLGKVAAKLSKIVLDSKAVATSASRFGSDLLAQAFPEGSPAHPAYPTGHGAVAGACITILKFFYDGAASFQNPLTPSPDGLSLLPYTGDDAGKLSVNGELHKIAHNISFGHGILGGIHWRSDTDWSIRLGEAVAINYLKDQVQTYNEKVRVSFTRLDGQTQQISN